MEDKLQIGAIVRTTAGHDAKNFFLLLSRENEIAYLVDGDKRPLQKPKKKNIKHIRYVTMSNLSINKESKDLENENSKIRKEIRRVEKTEVEDV